MKKTIIVIQGRANEGKTSALTEVINRVILRFPNAQENRLINGSDIKTVFTIGKTKLGIETQGDPKSRLPISLDDFSRTSCDMIICPCRTSGSTVHSIIDIANRFNYRVIWTKNYQNHSITQVLNERFADNTLELVNDVINGRI